MKFDYFLFDFDGTLADTGPGIRRSVAWALEQMGFNALDEAELNRFIGPPLHDCFVELCGMTDDAAEEAIRIYRQRYVDIGLYESRIYAGIAQLLRALHRRGAWVAIASAKPQFMLERLSEHYGLAPCIDAICGTGMGRHSADKRDLLMGALPPGADPSRAVMVGDRRFDIEAAKALGMAAAGADWGYSQPGELMGAGADFAAQSVSDMANWLLDDERPRGLFISLEGSDGCGKSTQLRRLREYLDARGYEVLLTREPGGCPIGERIREIILSLESRGMSAECEALLYAASRVEHVREVILPALNSGKIVISDRFFDSSIAYQAWGRELGEAFIRQINEPATKLAFPDLTLLLELDRSAARARMAQGAPLDRLETEKEDFFTRVQAGFDRLAAAEPGRVARIDAAQSVDDVFEHIRAAVDRALDAQA